MSKWAHSLIRLSGYQVEELQKRLAEISTRRATAEMRIAVLEAEREVEIERASMDAHASMQLAAYVQGWKMRRVNAVGELDSASAEEAGARDALARAFEEQKKFEHVAEISRLGELAKIAKVEAAAMDEVAIRRAVR